MKFNASIESVRTERGKAKRIKPDDIFGVYDTILAGTTRPEITILTSAGLPLSATYQVFTRCDKIPVYGDAIRYTELLEAESDSGTISLTLDVWQYNGYPVALYLHSGAYHICKYLTTEK